MLYQSQQLGLNTAELSREISERISQSLPLRRRGKEMPLVEHLLCDNHDIRFGNAKRNKFGLSSWGAQSLAEEPSPQLSQ